MNYKKNSKQPPKTADKSGLKREKASEMAFGRRNFILMAISGAAIIIGFLLMIGGSSTADEFNPDIFSTRRIVVGPTIAFLGFVFMAIAIIVNPDRKKAAATPKPEKDESTAIIDQPKTEK